MSILDLGHKLHDMAFEADPTPAKKPVTVSQPTSSTPTQVYTPPTTYVPPTPYQPSVLNATVSSENDAYNTLKARVSIEGTPVYQILNKYLAPLEKVPLDPKTKFTTAWAQAQAIDGLTKEQFLSALTAVFDSLTTAQTDFTNWLQSQTDSMVKPKQDQIDQLTVQINDLNQQIQAASSQIQQLAADKADAEAKVARALSQFNSAIAVRTREITSQKEQYEALLA